MKMNKKVLSAALAAALAVTGLVGCGKDNSADGLSEIVVQEEAIPTETEESAAEETTAPEEEENPAEIPEGCYLSELTGEPISEDIKDQRPIAVMVDNEKTALPHYGTADADIVYELMNSTENDRVTRLMCVFKDWGDENQIGSVRSTRPTNIPLMAEYNAVLCHDGGPYYIDTYLANAWADHLSGVFSRVSNGKDWEFTEYVCKGDVQSNLDSAGISSTYNDYKPDRDSHFLFVDYGTELNLDEEYDNAIDATDILRPIFKHNNTEIKYNESTGTYDYYEYGSQHLDAETNAPLTFKNVILQKCSFAQLDENGYLVYNYLQSNEEGYYLTNGKAIPITWSKLNDTDITKYYDMDGNEIKINTGKTFITLVPDDGWDSMTLN